MRTQALREKGVVLPALTLVSVILITLATAILVRGTGSLRTATFDHQSDQAIYAAETGIVYAIDEYNRLGEFRDSLEGKLAATNSHYKIEVFYNDSSQEQFIEGGILLPANTMYLLSEGTSGEHITRRAGALFRIGLGAFQAGLISDSLSAGNATFDAYNSQKDKDPNLSKETDKGILANHNVPMGGEQFHLADTTVEGAVFVAPGTNPTTAIVKSGTTMTARESVLAEPINVAEVQVPDLPAATPPSGGTTTPGSTTWSGNFQIGELRVQGSSSGLRFYDTGLNQTLFNIRPDGSLEPFHTGQSDLIQDDTNMKVYRHFNSQGTRLISIDRGGNTTIRYQDANHEGSGEMVPPAEFIEALFSGGVSNVENPSTLENGRYGTVTIDDGTPTELEDGTFVVKDLKITNGGQLKLGKVGETDKKAKIYVTGTIQVDGAEAIVNNTKLPPNLQIFYVGDDKVFLSGGSSAYFTLVAPHADIELKGMPGEQPTKFFGALLGKHVTVENAEFHYDTEAEEVGTGQDGSKIYLLNRHRL